jgi:cell division protein FtsI/penicillin-binding protein 2
VRIQVGPVAQDLRDQGDVYNRQLHTFYPERGQIYDRWGNLLAGNETVYEVGIDLRTKGKSPETIAYVLSKVLGPGHPEYDSETYYYEVLQLASTVPTTTTIYRVAADFVTQQEVDEIREWSEQYEMLYRNRKEKDRLTLTGLAFRPHYQRTYPEKDLGANVIGFVSREGIGYFGVEAAYNPVLAGEPESVWMAVDPNVEVCRYSDGRLILTIDAILGRPLSKSGRCHHRDRRSGAPFWNDPHTGEIWQRCHPLVDLSHC